MRLSLLKTINTRLFGKPRPAKAYEVLGHVDMATETAINGWVLDAADLERAVPMEVVRDGEVIARGVPTTAREDVVAAGHGRLLCGFRIDLPADLRFEDGALVEIRDGDTGRPILGGPIRIEVNPNVARFRDRLRSLTPATTARFKRRYCNKNSVGISIVMPVYNTPAAWLREAVASVAAQWHERWELLCVDDCSTAPEVREVLRDLAAGDSRIRVLRPDRNGGISKATNLGIAAARYDFIGFMDHDDVLEPSALYHMAKACLVEGVDLAYSDEVVTDENIDHFLEFSARPEFSYDYYLNHPYFVHFIVCRKSLVTAIGGLDETLSISQDVDFVLRALEQADRVAHVPHFLYRWRRHVTSTGHSKKEQVIANTCAALTRSLARVYPGCGVSPGHTFNTYRVEWPEARGKTLIVIPTKNALGFVRKAVESIERHTGRDEYEIVIVDHASDDPAIRRYFAGLKGRCHIRPYEGRFNFSRMNNVAVADYGAGCDYVLFLNNDIEILSDGWLRRLRSLAARPDVGAVGPMLVYDNDRVQHAGVILGFHEAAEHALKLVPAYRDNAVRNPGYNAMLTSTRDFSAVTAACLMLRREVFEEVGGFDEVLDIGFNDTDLCLRIRRRGYKVLYDGDVVIRHYESATRNAAAALLKHPENTALFKLRWQALIRDGDPFYHPMLATEGTDHVLRRSRPVPRQFAPRVAKAGFAKGEAVGGEAP